VVQRRAPGNSQTHGPRIRKRSDHHTRGSHRASHLRHHQHVITLAASLLGADPAAQAAQATRVARVASPAGWPPGCDPTDDHLTTDSRHYKVRPGGEVREVVRLEIQYDSRVDLHLRNSRGEYVRGRVDLGILKAGCH
jgi:hypothetical protein